MAALVAVMVEVVVVAVAVVVWLLDGARVHCPTNMAMTGGHVGLYMFGSPAFFPSLDTLLQV